MLLVPLLILVVAAALVLWAIIGPGVAVSVRGVLILALVLIILAAILQMTLTSGHVVQLH